jgi:RNA-directed DNA polymerase
MVVKLYLEPEVEPKFHQDSYGYRPAKSALDAVAKARERCWESDWVIDLDISQFFDSLDHILVMEMVKKHTSCRWILLYIERWLKAPIQMADGKLQERDRGSPQGSVVSPLISNIFMHHVFDEWMRTQFPSIPFERYADDALAHCKTQKQAEYVKDAIAKRLNEFKLELHPEKTRIVYCKREGRNATYQNVQFNFLGYSFRTRSARNNRGEIFLTFSPAVSDKAAKTIRQTIRRWRLNRHSDKSLDDIAAYINPTVRGWLNYYGRFNKSVMVRALYTVNRYLLRWAVRKYKRFRRAPVKAWSWLGRVARNQTQLFVHWQWGLKPGAE